MNIHFMRHGEAEHTLNEPSSFTIKNPKLTKQGEMNTEHLKNKVETGSKIWVSPTVRTIDTGRILASNTQDITVVDIIGPRTYPYKKVNMNQCDEILQPGECNSFEYLNFLNGNHPNSINEETLELYLYNFFKDYLNDGNDHWVITHDGLIAFLTKIYEKRLLHRDDKNDLVKENAIKSFTIETLLERF
jgi:hypothetical protein